MEELRNLKRETIRALAAHGKTWEDVRFVLTENVRVADKDSFLESMDFEYDPGYGRAYIPEILIVGDQWWLERWEYDGSEGWTFQTMPVPPEKVVDLRLKPEKDKFGELEINVVRR